MERKPKKSPYYQLSLTCSKNLISPKKIRFVHRDIRVQKYLKLFIAISKNAKKCCSRTHRNVNVLKILDEVIPLEYFGTKRHKKLFYKIVKLILTQSKYECVYVKEITMGYDTKKIPWLSEIASEQLRRQYLCDGQLWLLEKIVKPLIRRLYTVIKTGQLYEVELVPKPIWSSFRQKVVNTLKNKKYLIPVNRTAKPRGSLEIIPKDGYCNPSKFRLIVKLGLSTALNRKKEKELARTIAKIIRHVASSICSTKTTNLYRCWNEYLVKIDGRKLYGVKIDVQNAFGNIDIDYMAYILDKLQRQGKVSMDLQTILTHHIKNQFVICGRDKERKPKVWMWNHGLCQGDRFSSALCQLYMSYLDSIHLQHLIKTTTFLHRTVDDYFFCSTEEREILEFIKIMDSLHCLNKDKTESNANGFNHTKVTYNGYAFCLQTGQVKTLYSFKKRTEIRHKFKLWNIKKPIYNRQRSIAIQKFLETSMIYSVNNFYFQNMQLNTIFNKEECVLQNYFEAMVFLAFKFDTAVMGLKAIIKDFSVITNCIRKIVFKYARKAFQKLQSNQGPNNSGKLNFQHFLKVGFMAFVCVCKKRKLYADHQVLGHVQKCSRRFSAEIFDWIDFEQFKRLPKVFEHISLQRRLPHHKSYLFVKGQ